eukprot:TRINITY_DN121589_c0_g1_i1.p1 TRINITY_DN121589_c0_g1~~TRINITY_DN121589_c0_g1_i1.p1  ORF type:complete len:462 (+),score=136.41 TRINITY_DN121589_c0_g1_i1:93-1478(+)
MSRLPTVRHASSRPSLSQALGDTATSMRARSSVLHGGANVASGPRAARARSSTFGGAAAGVFAQTDSRLLRDGAEAATSSVAALPQVPLLQRVVTERPPSDGGGGTLADAQRASAPTPPVDDGGGDIGGGLTRASLLHLRRQRDKLVDEKAKLEAELSSVSVLLKQLQERNAVVEEELRIAKEEAERQRAEALRWQTQSEEWQALAEERQAHLEEAQRAAEALKATVDLRDEEITRLRLALEEQRRVVKEVLETAGSAGSDDSERVAALERQVKELRCKTEELQMKNGMLSRDKEELQQQLLSAVLLAKQAKVVHDRNCEVIERLKCFQLGEAMKGRIALSMAVPKVTLNYNNAPPLNLSFASAIGEERIRRFLDKEVFVHFEPMWVSLDGVDDAPDGTTKKQYAERMLQMLTDAVKRFVEKAQTGDPTEDAGGPSPSLGDGGGSGPNSKKPNVRTLLESF